MRRTLSTVAFVSLMLIPGCKLRYEVKMPPKERPGIFTQVAPDIFQKKIPLNHELIRPASLREENVYNPSTSKELWRFNGRIQKINQVFELRSGDEFSPLKRNDAK